MKWNVFRSNGEILPPEGKPLWIVSDEELEGLPLAEAKALFARSEAEGAGDYEMTLLPWDMAGKSIVESYDVAIPDWSPEFMAAVCRQTTSVTERELAELQSDLHGSAQEQLDAIKAESDDLSAQFLQLIAERRASSADASPKNDLPSA